MVRWLEQGPGGRTPGFLPSLAWESNGTKRGCNSWVFSRFGGGGERLGSRTPGFHPLDGDSCVLFLALEGEGERETRRPDSWVLFLVLEGGDWEAGLLGSILGGLGLLGSFPSSRMG